MTLTTTSVDMLQSEANTVRVLTLDGDLSVPGLLRCVSANDRIDKVGACLRPARRVCHPCVLTDLEISGKSCLHPLRPGADHCAVDLPGSAIAGQLGISEVAGRKQPAVVSLAYLEGGEIEV